MVTTDDSPFTPKVETPKKQYKRHPKHEKEELEELIGEYYDPEV